MTGSVFPSPGTDAFVQNFVNDKCLAIIDYVDNLDSVDDGFIHYQFLRFCQATRLQYLNGQNSISKQNSLQQQHVDRRIADAVWLGGPSKTGPGWTWSSTCPTNRAASTSLTTP